MVDLLGAHEVEFGNGISPTGRPRLSMRLMASSQYLKNSFNLSEEEQRGQHGPLGRVALSANWIWYSKPRKRVFMRFCGA